jgi:hypothetical protein
MQLEKLTNYVVLNSEKINFIFGGQTKKKKNKKDNNTKNKKNNIPQKDSITNDVTSDSTDTVTNDSYKKRL